MLTRYNKVENCVIVVNQCVVCIGKTCRVVLTRCERLERAILIEFALFVRHPSNGVKRLAEDNFHRLD